MISIASPALALANTALALPLTVEVSVPIKPTTDLVPLKLAALVVSYTLLEAVNPLIVTGAAVILALNPVGWVNT